MDVLSEFAREQEQLSLTRQVVIEAIAEARAMVRHPQLAVARVRTVHDRTVRHCALQNEAFYQKLKFRHSGNSSALKIIDFFIGDLKELKVKLFVFDEKYLIEMRVGKLKDLPKDFTELSRDILLRLSTEEAQLAPLLV